MSLNKELDKVENVKINRRKAIKLASILPLAGYFGLVDGLDATNDPDYLPTEFGKKKLRLGIIGFGIRGEQLVRAVRPLVGYGPLAPNKIILKKLKLKLC